MTLPEFLRRLRKANEELKPHYKLWPAYKATIDKQLVWRHVLMSDGPNWFYISLNPLRIVFRSMYPDRSMPNRNEELYELVGLAPDKGAMLTNAIAEICPYTDETRTKRKRFSPQLRADLLTICGVEEVPFSERLVS